MKLGSGGMGEVWEGRHIQQDVPVAIKLINPQKTGQEEYREAFLNEVRAVAQLSHPAIPMVFDFGDVPASVEEASDGHIKAGAPYLVMELIGGGSVRANFPATSWEWAESVLFALLDALAYAHARNVLHRDIKPANVLFAKSVDGRPQPKLIDFGLAWLSSSSAPIMMGGTPGFQAPEQMLADRFREQGPCTDLYSLGCLAYAMVCGGSPFLGRTHEETTERQLTGPTPPVVAKFPVPDGFSVWLGRMMAPEPADRFQHAADAAQGLKRLGALLPIWSTAIPRNLGGIDQSAQTTLAAGFQRNVPTLCSVLTGQESQPAVVPLSSGATPVSMPFPIAPVPKEWSTGRPRRTSMQLVGAGLSLFELRRIPIVNRENERNTLWQSLIDVSSKRESRVVLLHGPAGTGKSRLAQWLCERANEIGAASVLKASFSPHNSPNEGITRGFERFLNCVGLGRARVQQRVKQLFRQLGASHPLTEEILVDLLRSPLSTTTPSWLMSEVRYAILLRTLCAYAKQRPVILWFDDIQWSVDSIAFVSHIINHQSAGESPILVLLTAQDEALAERDIESALLEKLTVHPWFQRIPVGPLLPEHSTELIGGLLNIDGELAQRLDKRTKGNPLFAVQLVGNWVNRGLLEVCDTGFRLRPGQEASIPDDAYSVWITRIRRVAGSAEVAAPSENKPELAYELAAVLGYEVDMEEWATLCQSAGVSIERQWVDALYSHCLAVPTESGWRFAHNMLRESLERSANEAGRLTKHHSDCARMLEQTYRSGRLGLDSRRASHLIAAGEFEAALEPLYQATQQSVGAHFSDAIRWARKHKRIVDMLDLTPEHPQAVKQALLELNNQRIVAADLESCRDQTGPLLERAAKCGDTVVHAQALYKSALINLACGRLPEAQTLLSKASRIVAGASNFGDLKGKPLQLLGEIEMRRGNYDEAWRHFRQAETIARNEDLPVVRANALVSMARIAAGRGDFDEAFCYLDDAKELFLRGGTPQHLDRCLGTAGDLERRRGNLEKAKSLHLQSMQVATTLGIARRGYGRLNLAHVSCRQGHYAEAQTSLETVIERACKNGLRGLEASATGALLTAVAGQSQWHRFDEIHQRAVTLFAETQFSEYDDGESFEIAGDLAADAGQNEHAKTAYTSALKIWRRLKISHRESKVERALRAL